MTNTKNVFYRVAVSIISAAMVLALAFTNAITTYAESDALSYTVIGDALSVSDVLGNARYYGIVADTWNQAEAETNAAVNTLNSDGSQSGNDLTAGDDTQPWVIGDLNVSGDGSFEIKGTDAVVYTPGTNNSKIYSNNTISFVDTSEEDCNTYVNDMLEDIAVKSRTYASKNSISGTLPTPVTDGSDQDHSTTNYVIDLTGESAGTYYLDLTDIYSDYLANQSGALKIKINSGQTVVLNVLDSGSVNLQKFNVEIDGETISSDTTNKNAEDIATHVVWNLPNATEVNLVGSVVGMILAVNATVNIYNTGAGWLVADTVNSYSGEWHNIWQSYDQDYDKIGTLITMTKTLEGGTLKSGQFSFTLYDEDGEEVETVTNDADGNITFSALTYTKAGTYNYYVQENVPDDAVDNGDGTATYDGVVYDTTKHEFTVTVSAVSTTYSKNLKAVVSIDDDAKTFTNKTEEADDVTMVTFGGTKVFENGTLTAGAFSFNLKDSDGNVIDTASVTKDGTFTFNTLTYQEEGTYTYTVSEVLPDGVSASHPAKDGITYDTDEHTVTVTVKKVDGKLEASVSEGEAGTFTNTYSATGSLSLSATKTYTNKTLKDGEFSFVLKDSDGNVLQTVTNDADGNINFSAISYTYDDLKKGTITYTVSEVQGDDTKVDYDETVYTVTVTLKDNGDGTITATPVITKDGTTVKTMSFSNTYNYETTTVSGMKTWVDDNDNDNIRPDSITVHLYADGVEADSKTVTADDNWTYSFTNLRKYADEDETQEIVYTVKEDAVDGYTTTYSGYDITNTHENETTSATVKKVWVNNGNEDAPATLKVTLYADGEEVTTVTLSAVNGWSYTFDDLTKYNNGKEISYTFTEEMVEGYTSGKTVSGNTTTFTNTYTTTTHDVSIRKTDVGGQDLAGAKIEIRDTDGHVIDSYTTDGTTHTTTLAAGTYTMVETTAPKGYEVAGSITFTVDNNGKVTVNGEEVTTVTMVDEYEEHTVKVRKTDSHSDALSGAKLQVLDSDGNVVASWTTNGKTKTLSLAYGTYTLHETSAPEGYDLADDITFTVEKDGTITVDGETVSAITMIDNKTHAGYVAGEDDEHKESLEKDQETESNDNGDVAGETEDVTGLVAGAIAAVDTGDSSPILIFALVAIVAIVVLVLLTRKKDDQ